MEKDEGEWKSAELTLTRRIYFDFSVLPERSSHSVGQPYGLDGGVQGHSGGRRGDSLLVSCHLHLSTPRSREEDRRGYRFVRSFDATDLLASLLLFFLASSSRDEYFGPDNEMCLCLTCENAGKGWYKDRSKPSSSSTDLVNSPASSDVSFATATTSSITATTSKLCISTSGAPLSSSSHRSLNNDHDSLPGTPGSSSSVDPPFEAAPIPPQGRVLRGKAISGGEVVPGAERILWGEEGEEEKREKGCRRCRAGVEMRFVNETWVEREGGCMR